MAGAIKLSYFIIACLHIVLFYFVNHDSAVIAITKVLLMPLLLGLIFIYKKENHNENDWTKVMIAIFFSFLGDLFLSNLFEQDYFFIIGLSCFLVTHLFYTSIFYKSTSSLLTVFKLKNILPTILLLIWILSFYLFIDNYLGELQIPVMIYMFVIGFMALASLSRKDDFSKSSFLLVITGVILFMVSDMILAINKFAFAIDYSSTYIMASYLLAQYLIVDGLYKEFN